jgi:CDP-diacylglycerol--glycerol-3-phosphate 3-phosphatidyltransferase
MFTVPNVLSFLRLVLSFSFLRIKTFSISFYIIFTICVVTDILDGHIARKTNNMTVFGEKLDSLADLLLVVVLIYKIFPLIEIPFAFVIWIFVIIGIRVLSMIVVYQKFKTFGILHTYLNKFTGLLLLLGVFLLPFLNIIILGSILCVTGTLAAIEELMIHLSSKVCESDLKSIFLK